jgi:hypothetical protein
MLNPTAVSNFVDYANTFDLVIQNTPFGYASQETENDLTWLPCVNGIKTRQIMVLHDGNLKRNAPWIYQLQDNFTAIACVHEAAVKAADFFTIPRNLIFNPFDLSRLDSKRKIFSQRRDAIISPQTFKPIKRVESLIRAIPHFREISEINVAGEGIEYNYMTSKDKCKSEYFVSRDTDPDASEVYIGRKAWDVALESGMKYLGPIHGDVRDQYLSDVKFLVDSSWSKSYGEHYNRTIFECMIQGAIPIAVNLGISDNESGNGKLLHAGVNYLMLEYDLTPKQYAEKIDSFTSMSDEEAQIIVDNNDALLNKWFNRKNVAQQYIDLAEGKDSGFYEKNLVGIPDPALLSLSLSRWHDQFDKPVSASIDDFFS